MSDTVSMIKQFQKKYPKTVAWRLRKNAAIVEKYLNSDEKIEYIFAAQKNDNPFDVTSTCVVALTNKRILIGRKRVLFGYFVDSVTPDLFNDLKILSGIIWGKVHIDTVKEFITLSNIDKRALPEIESRISGFMMEAKQKYANQKEE